MGMKRERRRRGPGEGEDEARKEEGEDEGRVGFFFINFFDYIIQKIICNYNIYQKIYINKYY